MISSRIILMFIIVLLTSSNSDTASSRQSDKQLHKEIKFWSTAFGTEMKDASSESTCKRDIKENFEKMKAKVERIDAQKLLEIMKSDVSNMLNNKIEAVKKVAVEAERLANNHTFDRELVSKKGYSYLNAKKIGNLKYLNSSKANAIELFKHQNFDGVEVNKDFSAIHVPVNVYDEKIDLVNDVLWSEGLTEKFKNNFAFDPGLSWQYFASSTGFLRIYPAAKWRVPQYVKDHPTTGNHESGRSSKAAGDTSEGLDLYDARLRTWYIQAASSPKDMIILLDGSGSMTGQRKEIARQVVINILDTLTDDDFVNVIRFSEILEPVSECFGMNKLVRASKQNIREFKERLDGMNTSDISNFTLALTHSFETLNEVHKQKEGTLCNQVIMLVTDGAPDTYTHIFERYNWPRIPVRVFTYLVGREVIETKEVNWMACHNRGYYTHVANLAEVREQVLKYTPVMSRPLVLYGPQHRPFVWTPVYADVTDIPLSNWAWEERQKEKIRAALRNKRDQGLQLESDIVEGSGEPSVPNEDVVENLDKEEKDYEEYIESQYLEIKEKRSKSKRSSRKHPSSGESYSDIFHLGDAETDVEYGQFTSYSMNNAQPLTDPSSGEVGGSSDGKRKKKVVNLMTTISAPVYDMKNYTNITIRILVKNEWKERIQEIRTANLLGVVGIDVPIKEIVQLTPAYKLGVNGYSFAITNNGYILYHPDLRPIFQEMLKPFYNSVDLTEVELPDSDEPNDPVEAMRKNMIDRVIGWKNITVKIHSDSMRRVVVRTNVYHWGPLENTSFSLGISLPEPYGRYRVDGQIEVMRRDEDYSKYFKGGNWKVHPDWLYCANNMHLLSGTISDNPEDVIREFLDAAKQSSSGYRWRTSSKSPQVYDKLSCEKDLVQSLVFDAKATNIDLEKCSPPKSPSKYTREITKLYGIVLTFASTRTGLTRFEDHRSEKEGFAASASIPGGAEMSFQDVHVRATDELFYKRAVDYNIINEKAFVYSVPGDAASRSPENIYVTASQAIFIGNSSQRAPAATIGTVYRHKMFAEKFFNSTKICGQKKCSLNCIDDQMTSCLLVDNNGYILVANDTSFTGKILFEYDPVLFDALLEHKIFQSKHIYDYQAICIDSYQVSGPGNILMTPFFMVVNLMSHIWTHLSLIAFDLYLNPWNINLNTIWAQDEEEEGDYDEDKVDDDEPGEVEERKFINKTRPRPCIKEIDLYEINSSWFMSGDPSTFKHPKCLSDCPSTFIAQPVPFTNLISVVIMKEKSACFCPSVGAKKFEPVEVTPLRGECNYVSNERYRKGHNKCINQHPEEENIKICGRGSLVKPSPFLTSLILILVATFKFTFGATSQSC